ncbi:SRPBCC domain-containing protein [Lentzea sp. BCCO 10_0856]|uniref:SRPBCC domain-containing protein n=1 Tax=Lentzea miocenica TaxID=3095431 RepID=A0ABU4TBB7_9PSEU|nr:SRPBCC domain-containing protein [Lentzea sp. BCCO 10_0856]MDX8035461.1 SRPBCC domain-containing protein [Lentzea sp. BCCO 10_0856]
MISGSSDEGVRIEITVAAPVDEVWRSFREKEKIRHWHGWDLPELDAEIDHIYFEHAEEGDGHVLLIQGHDTFTLTPVPEGTRVVLTRAPKGTSPEWDDYYDDITEGWITFMHQLKFAHEFHPGAARRTVFWGREVPLDVSGKPFFESANQRGQVVEEWGPGLLITCPKMTIATTYGFSDDELEALRQKGEAS